MQILKKQHPLIRELTTSILLIFCSWSGIAQSNRIVFTPHWIPQAQFAGYYVALNQGFYREAGLEVEIKHLTANISSFQFLKTGDSDIVSSFLMDAIKQRSAGVPLINIGQLSQHAALMLVTKKTSGIDEPQKLNGKKVGIWSSGFDDVPLAFMHEKGIEWEFTRILNTVNLFLMDGVDALTVMYYNEYDQVINSGVDEEELNRFFFSDYGLDIPEDGLYCLESTLHSRRNDLTAFLKATLRGWEYARQNREHTLDMVINEMNKAHLPNNRAHQRWMLDKVLEMMTPGEKEVKNGQLLELDFNRAVDVFHLANTQPDRLTFSYNAFFFPLIND